MSQTRQPKGVPVGGQYAENTHDEATALLDGYTRVERTTDYSGKTFRHFAVGECRSATPNEKPDFSVQGIRFEKGTRVVMLAPEKPGVIWEDPVFRAPYLAADSYLGASVQRVDDHRDFVSRTVSPCYVVEITRSVKDPVTHEYEHRTFKQEFVNPAGIPSRSDAIYVAVERAIEFESYEDEDDYVAQSDREYEDAVNDYHELRDRTEELRTFLGDEYDHYVHGTVPAGSRYEFVEKPQRVEA